MKEDDNNAAQRREVIFGAGLEIVGTFLRPAGRGPFPGVVLAHGWGMCAGGDLQEYARVISAKGIITLTFDFRNLGKSGGDPRQELDPQKQIEDYRSAITWLSEQPDVDSKSIGIWGTSYSGGHVLVVAATDPRVKAVVTQVPTISGPERHLRRSPGEHERLEAAFEQDRDSRHLGRPPAMWTTTALSEGNVVYRDPDSFSYMTAHAGNVAEWRNEVTIKSLELATKYEPGIWIGEVAPIPLLMIVADSDTITPTDLQLKAFDNAQEPKKLVVLPGRHYSVYLEHFSQTSQLAASWFVEHLCSRTKTRNGTESDDAKSFVKNDDNVGV